MLNRFAIFLLSALTGVCGAAEEVPSDTVSVRFRQSHSNLDPAFSGNGERLDSMIQHIRGRLAKDSTLFISKVSVVGGASPEGSIEINRKLSKNRADRIFDWLSEKIEIQDSAVDFNFLGRDWNGLLEIVEADANVPNKNEVEELIRNAYQIQTESGSAPESLLQQFKEMHNGKPYTYLYRTAFPVLRESRVIIGYDTHLPLKPSLQEIGDYGISTTADVPQPTDLQVLEVMNQDRPCRPFYMDLKTNLLYDAAALPTIGAEFYVGRDWSVGVDWTYGWWDKNSTHHYWRAYGGDVYIRRWFGKRALEKPLTGHHLGIYAGITTYDFEFGGSGIMGGLPGGAIWDRCMYLTGIEYGYSLPVTRRLNIDFTLGFGYLGGKTVKYEPKNGYYQWKSTHRTNWIGPTKAEISLVWLIGCDNYNRPKGGKK